MTVMQTAYHLPSRGQSHCQQLPYLFHFGFLLVLSYYRRFRMERRVEFHRVIRMGADIARILTRALQRLFRITFLALDKRKEQNNIPIAYREDMRMRIFFSPSVRTGCCIAPERNA
jgi:hypothetical protein